MEDSATPPISDGRYGLGIRSGAAAFSGIVAGILVLIPLQAGAALLFGQAESRWSLMFWGEHWAVRTVAGWVSSAAAGVIAGLIVRRWGALLGLIVGLPSVGIWAFVALVGWGWVSGSSRFPAWVSLHSWELPSISLGNAIAASVLALSVGPACAVGGSYGAELGASVATHFDSRRGTLLGLRWYHYIWFPMVLFFVVLQTAAASLYGFSWLRGVLHGGLGLGSLFPFVFFYGVYWIVALTWRGTVTCYSLLSRLTESTGRSNRTLAIFKNGIGLPVAGAAMLLGIMWLHETISRLLSK